MVGEVAPVLITHQVTHTPSYCSPFATCQHVQEQGFLPSVATSACGSQHLIERGCIAILSASLQNEVGEDNVETDTGNTES